MDIIGMLGWLLAAILGWVWSLVWLLIGGWVSTLLQIVVIVFAVFALKFGWRRAPIEIASRVRPAAGWLWRWATSRESTAANAGSATVRTEVHTIRVKSPGDVNLSSLLNVVMLAGLMMLGLL